MYCEVVSLLQDFTGDVHLIMSVAVEAHFGYPMPNIALSQQRDFARRYVFQCYKSSKHMIHSDQYDYL